MAYSGKIEKSWIQDGISNEAVEWAKIFGEHLGMDDSTGRLKALSTSQLRKFFGELRRIDSDFDNKKTDIIMLKPMLAYAVGRDKSNTKIRDFEKEISKGIGYIRLGDRVHERSDFKNFLKIFEAIVAYHKFYGGK